MYMYVHVYLEYCAEFNFAASCTGYAHHILRSVVTDYETTTYPTVVLAFIIKFLNSIFHLNDLSCDNSEIE